MYCEMRRVFLAGVLIFFSSLAFRCQVLQPHANLGHGEQLSLGGNKRCKTGCCVSCWFAKNVLRQIENSTKGPNWKCGCAFLARDQCVFA